MIDNLLAGREDSHAPPTITSIPSWEATRERVLEEITGGYDIALYAGHGLFDPDEPDASRLFFWEKPCSEALLRSLVREDKLAWPSDLEQAALKHRGRVLSITAKDLRQALSRTGRTRLFYLSAC